MHGVEVDRGWEIREVFYDVLFHEIESGFSPLGFILSWIPGACKLR